MSHPNRGGKPLPKTKWILFILAFCIVLGGLLAAWLIIVNIKVERPIAKIYQNGEEIQAIDLSQVTESYTVEVTGDHGERNVVLVEPGQISMKEASCPDQICVNTGVIDSGVLPITCLPNKVVIKIVSESN